MKNSPLIFDIRRGSFDNGPGIRTTVFFKGCPLRCVWCHNPESMESCRELAFYPEHCLKCGECFKVCPSQAITLEGNLRINRTKCNLCADCAKICPAGALKVVGQYYPVNKLLELLLRDKVFYQVSGGGVTFSGGEPLLFINYLSEIIQALKQEKIHTAIQTAGYFSFPEFAAKILPYLDLVMFDLKIYDSAKHKYYTGYGNKVILDNFTRLPAGKVSVIPRVPLIPNITAVPENLIRIAEFLRKHSCRNYSLLPFNPGGISKWERLGKDIPGKLRDSKLEPAREEQWRELFEKTIQLR
ncbi:MAG TPA: glycyl-radical enzyme activating protein [Desulfitobacteriaceae bacterium]|nr:glycyl-radical enzyme activating protein [Desulfitobacteriaceae bacterium]